MSNVKKSNKKSEAENDGVKEKAEIDNEELFENKIVFPRSSNSNSNDISKLNSSFFSSVDSDKKNKNISDYKNSGNQKEKNKINMINLGNEIDSIINGENSEDKRESNFSSEKVLFDEINKAEKLSAENE